MPFPEVAGLEEDETVVLATLTLELHEHRDEVEDMQDPKVGEIMGAGAPFDPSRMASGGVELLVGG